MRDKERRAENERKRKTKRGTDKETEIKKKRP